LGDLPRAVIERRHDDLLAGRQERLSQGNPRDLAHIVGAYAMPLIEYASSDAGWKAYARVWAQLVCGFSWDKKLGSIIESDAETFIALIGQAEPRLSEQQTWWAFMFMMGAVGAVCADNARIDRLSQGRFSSSDLPLIAENLIPYV